jgi:CheY-like chemotaxis protein
MVLIGDKLRVNQVLINLLGNAVKFTAADGEIDFYINLTEETIKSVKLYFSVSDTGIGISEEQKSKLFMPFEQTHKEITAKFGGTGLGLAISQNLIGMMGSVILVESEPGSGSRFYFELCFDKGEEIIREDKEDIILDLTGKRVLIAEDIDINRLILFEMLSSTGISIDEAENGKIAVEKFAGSAQGYYDLIFMDIQMPVMNGYEAVKQIRLLDRPDAKDIPIIALSANADKEDVNTAIAAGMNGHISKPADSDIVMNCLEKYIT